MKTLKLNLDDYTMEHKKKIKTNGPFINRELSWVDFNERVLYYTRDKSVPLNERLKFLGITDSNLNEFISVRFSYAKKNKDVEPYKELLRKIKNFIELQGASYDLLKYDMKKKGYEITKMSKLDKKEIRKLEKVFTNEIFPILTPISMGTTNNGIRVENGQLCIACLLEEGSRTVLNIIPISSKLDQFIVIDNKKIILIEDLIEYFISSIFINKLFQKPVSRLLKTKM